MATLYSDLNEIKKILQIAPQNTAEDFQLGLYAEWASDILAQAMNRDSIAYQVRTWYYPGSGNQKLPLRHRPVYPNVAPAKCSKLPFTAIQVIEDDGGNYGFSPGGYTGTPLTFGTDYTIRIDQDDGGSREAILYRVGDYWTKPIDRENGMLSPFVGEDLGSFQVIYTAGYTVDTLPPSLRAAADLLVTRLRYIMPLGMQLTSESYIERSIGLSENHRKFLLGMIEPIISPWRNWYF